MGLSSPGKVLVVFSFVLSGRVPRYVQPVFDNEACDARPPLFPPSPVVTIARHAPTRVEVNQVSEVYL